ncbi:MAG: MBL fold metallo-hydrolase [Planctomycetales bacterium]|nr:MBL fold metallo-hydrolase [bacterium]UNM06878.1 MAG: MBL fold metallo-hydrolase [Planctomycetales bacterium]
MRLRHWVCGPLDNNIYLLEDEAAGRCVLFDPGIDIGPVFQHIDDNGLEVERILLTHAHFDHIFGLAEAKRRYNCPIHMHPDDEEVRARFLTICENWGFPGADAPPEIDEPLSHGQRLQLLGTSCEVRHTPGHAPGQVAFVFDNFAIVGDTLFQRSIGRYDLPGSDPQALVNSIMEQLYSLPDETVVYPGHGGFTTIGEERRFNPYVGEGARFRLREDD